MADPSLLPEERLRQYPDRGPWKDHGHHHYKQYIQTCLDEGKPPKCPHIGIRCVSAFNSAKQLKFHLLDVHCPDFIKEPTVLETPGEWDQEPARLKLPRRSLKKDFAAGKDVKWEYHFIDETAETVHRNKVSMVPTANSSSSTSTIDGPPCWAGTNTGSATSTNTPPSPYSRNSPASSQVAAYIPGLNEVSQPSSLSIEIPYHDLTLLPQEVPGLPQESSILQQPRLVVDDKGTSAAGPSGPAGLEDVALTSPSFNSRDSKPACDASEITQCSQDEHYGVDCLLDEWKGWFYVKWLDGSCSWEPRKNILDDTLIKDVRRDSRGLNSGVEVVCTRRKGAKAEY